MTTYDEWYESLPAEGDVNGITFDIDDSRGRTDTSIAFQRTDHARKLRARAFDPDCVDPAALPDYHVWVELWPDRGVLEIGVYRDSVLNTRNDFRLFEEEWLEAVRAGMFAAPPTKFQLSAIADVIDPGAS